MTDLAFLLFRTLFITTMTVGMMASLTEFRFGLRKLLCIMALYSLWVLGSSLALLVLLWCLSRRWYERKGAARV